MSFYVAMRMKTKFEVFVVGQPAEIPASSLADDCIGFLMVFSTKEAAAEFAGENGEAQEIQERGKKE